MTSTVFVNGVTLTDEDWFNDLNRLHYTLLQDPNAAYYLCNGRLTLTTGVPVTTADVTAAGTIYFAPYKGSKIALYDGSTNWKVYNFTELSLALTLTSGKPYDIFCYDNSGVPTLESLVWTNDTTRATALTTQNGVLVKTGATTRRYLGTIYSSGANTTEDSVAKRYVWNYYNRVNRFGSSGFSATRSTGSTTWTELNTEIRNQFVIGFAEDQIYAQLNGTVSNDTLGATTFSAISIDSTTVPLDTMTGTQFYTATALAPLGIGVSTIPSVGFHFTTAVGCAGSNTASWSGAAFSGTSTRTNRCVLVTRIKA